MTDEKDAPNGDKKNPRALKLQSGKTIEVNLNGWTWEHVREYVRIAIPERLPEKTDFKDDKERKDYEAQREQSAQEELAALRRCYAMRGMVCGLSGDEVEKLGWEDQTLLGRKINELIANPLGADPS